MILDPVGVSDAVGIDLWGAGGDVVQQTAEAIGCGQIARAGAGAIDRVTRLIALEVSMVCQHSAPAWRSHVGSGF